MSHVDLPEDVVRLAEAQVAAGRARSIEDVVRAGVAAIDQQYDEKLAALRTAIDEGDASGEFQGDAFAETRAKHGLTGTSR